MTYTVTKVTVAGPDERITATKHSTHKSRVAAMIAARALANVEIDADCLTYGPSSFAYNGAKITAVVSWE